MSSNDVFFDDGEGAIFEIEDPAEVIYVSVLPGKRDYTAWRGGTWRKVLTIYTGDTEDSDPRNLTGCTASLTIKDPNTDAVLKSLTTSNGGIALGGSAGTVTLYISDEDTAAFTWQAGVYQLFITSASGDTDPILYGKFRVTGI